MTIVFKVSDNIKAKMINHYQKAAKSTKPPYAVFQANDADTVITLYESGKVMFQGLSADIDAQIWLEMERRINNRIIDINQKKEPKPNSKPSWYLDSTIGSDEVGTGDYFGPIVVSAAYVSAENTKKLITLGVCDSKLLTDEQIKKIAPQLMQIIPYTSFVLDNPSYNQMYEQVANLNKIKAILHNKALLSLLNKADFTYQKIVVDQFVYPQKYFAHLADTTQIVRNITFETKAESRYLSVAAASIISRYLFLKALSDLSREIKVNLPLGAGTLVDQVAKEIFQKHGLAGLSKIAKLNFKNTYRVTEK